MELRARHPSGCHDGGEPHAVHLRLGHGGGAGVADGEAVGEVREAGRPSASGWGGPRARRRSSPCAAAARCPPAARRGPAAAPAGGVVLGRAVEQQLQADADAEQVGALAHRLADRLLQAALRRSVAMAGAGGALSPAPSAAARRADAPGVVRDDGVGARRAPGPPAASAGCRRRSRPAPRSQHALGGGQRRRGGVGRAGRAQGARQRLERRLDDVVVVLAVAASGGG